MHMHLVARVKMVSKPHSLLLHILRESPVRGQSWSQCVLCAGRSPGKKDGHLTISRIPADSSLAWRLETAGSVYCVMMSHKSGASLWNVLGNENAVQCFYMLTQTSKDVNKYNKCTLVYTAF